MIAVAGIDCPCLDCGARCTYARQTAIYQAVFSAIATREPVVCVDYQERTYHGLESVRP